MGKKYYNKHNKGSGRKDNKSRQKPKEKKNDYNKSIITEITRTFNGFKDLSELNNLEKLNKPHFADENGFAYQVAYQFSLYGEPINSNQLRKFYSEIKTIEREGSWEKAELGFNLLKPKFAISVSRKSGDNPLIHKDFYYMIKATMDKVKVENDLEISFANLKTFARFFEAIVAYHKLHNQNFDFEMNIRKEIKKQIPKGRNNRNRNKNNSKKRINSKEVLNDIFNNISMNIYKTDFDYETFKQICDEINCFSSLDELNHIKEKFNRPSFEDEDGYASIVAQQFSQVKGKKINSNQIRRFYNEVKNIERYGNWEDAKTDFYLLKPRLAISVARKSSSGNLIPYEFYHFIRTVMDKVYIKDDPKSSFKNLQLFATFFEAIVGFHKYYELSKN